MISNVIAARNIYSHWKESADQTTSFMSVQPSTTNEPDKVYIGLTEGEWKKRYYNHTQSFRTKRYANSTTLSSYVRDVKAKQM